MVVGKRQMPESRCWFYQDLMLPVFDEFAWRRWQANCDRWRGVNNSLLRRTGGVVCHNGHNRWRWRAVLFVMAPFLGIGIYQAVPAGFGRF